MFTESLLNFSVHFLHVIAKLLVVQFVLPTSIHLLTFAMDVDDETDSAMEEAGTETDLDTDKEDELWKLIYQIIYSNSWCLR